MTSDWTVGRYLVHRLHEVGVRHVFGVPGDYVLGLMDDLVVSPIELVGTCNELNAGYAADAYARINGVGAACVTYAVGGFSLLNAVAGAFAERVPLIAVSGAPSREDARSHKLLHHTLGEYGIQVDVYRNVTAAAIGLKDAGQAPRQIDATITTALRQRRPVFIEVPVDLVGEPCASPGPLDLGGDPPSDRQALAEAVEEAVALLSKAARPVILGGVELHRFGLADQLEKLVDQSGFPIATALMDKSVIRETHPQYVGVFCGALSDDSVRRTVEETDCLLALGAWMSDVNLGVYTARIETEKLIHATADRVAIKHHYFEPVYLGDFIRELGDALAKRKTGARKPVGGSYTPAASALARDFTADPQKRMTVARFYERLNHFLDEDMIVLADAGDSFLCAGNLVMRERTAFICQAYYCSIGFTVPGALGVGLAAPDHRPVVFVGDGAFQMTAQELSTIIRQGLSPVIFVMNNHGYTIERVIHDGPYNDIGDWKYHMLPEVFGSDGWSCQVRTEADLEGALARASARRDQLALIEVDLDPHDASPALQRLGAAVAARHHRK